MAIQNIECQIATVLMKRFLDGDNLPQNLLDDLEKHLKVCPSCQQVLKNEKADIEEVLDGVSAPKGVAAMIGKFAAQPATASGFATAGAGEALLQASYHTSQTSSQGMAVFKNPKVLFLSIALATVLIAMSTLLKNPTQFLGSKASAGNLYTEPHDDESSATDGKDEHSDEENHGAEADESETSPESDSSESPHGHEGDSSAGKPEEAHKDDEPKHEPQAQPKLSPDPRVPGEPTLDQTDLIVVGGSQPKPADKKEEPVQKKTTTTSHHKTTAKPTASQPKSPVKRRTTPTSKRTNTKKNPAPKPSGSGIKVYDEHGKAIN